MRGLRGILVSIVSLWVAAVLQQALGRFGLWEARPDFLIVFAACLCLYSTPAGGAAIGFVAGALTGAISGANLTHYVVSRSLSGFLDSWARNFEFDSNALVAAVNAFVFTAIAQVFLMFFAPPPGITSFLGATIGSAMVNGVLAVPVHALLRRILGPQGT